METTTNPHTLDLQFRGHIRGHLISSKDTQKPLCKYYGGIPYANPPKGPLRFRRPSPLAPCYRYGTRDDPGIFDGEVGICPQVAAKEATWDEDCLQLNVWVPEGGDDGEKPEEGGWPVYFWIHGGFLQLGSPNHGDPVNWIANSKRKCILVKPGYRLNVFGFLASKELAHENPNTHGAVGNLGFWDLRIALEWVYKSISYFGGNPTRITVGGYSAGAHAAFFQLQYDLKQPTSKQIIKRCVMHSNGPGVQPKSLDEAQKQFDELLKQLNISQSLDAKKKLERLRDTPATELVNASKRMAIHQFRAVTDGDFIATDLFAQIRNGDLGRKMKERNVHLIIGDCSEEHFVYAQWRPPTKPGIDALAARLRADYPPKAVKAIIKTYFKQGDALPANTQNWKEAFGRLYSDIQIHIPQRGLIDGLVRGGAGHLIKRYRIEWRSSLASTRKEWGATHAADGVIWFFGDGRRVPVAEAEIMQRAYLDLLSDFLAGNNVGWGTDSPLHARRLKSDGTVDIWRDPGFDESLRIWYEISNDEAEGRIVRPKL